MAADSIRLAGAGFAEEKERWLGPISLEPIFQERIWGTEALPDWYAQPAPGKPIGEAWLTAEQCAVASGAMQGSTLAELVKRNPKALAGDASGEFPLLLKMLFPREKLSVQVHPNDEQAIALGQTRGKTECWYILSAEPGAQVAIGFRDDISPDMIRSAIEDNSLEDKLQYLAVKAGDLVYVNAGTVHAIGPGLVVLETQQYSDVTYRLYDYGRPRELHVDAGLAVSRTASDSGLKPPMEMNGFTRLVTSPYFVVDRFRLHRDRKIELGKLGEMQLLVATGDGCLLESTIGRVTPLKPGHAVLLPAEEIAYGLHARNEAEVIRIAQR